MLFLACLGKNAKKSSICFSQISATFKTGFNYGLNAATALKPSHVSQKFKSVALKIK